jgi:hypothetical protein
MAPNNTTGNDLQECLERMKCLEEENRQLRESSWAFGELAERLNVLLSEERRPGGMALRERRSYTAELSLHMVNDKD